MVELEEDALLQGVPLSPGNEKVVITDKEQFLDFVTNQICNFGDSGDFEGHSRMTALVDQLITYAAESAAGCIVDT